MNRTARKIGCTIKDIKPGWEWVSTEILDVCDGVESTLSVEGSWILDSMILNGIHPKAKEFIRRRSELHPLLKIKDGTCLNCHKNSDKFESTEYYQEWLKGQGWRSALGNTRESRLKALKTRSLHEDSLRQAQSERMGLYAQTEDGKWFMRMLNKAANSPGARRKAEKTRHDNMDQWICLQEPSLEPLPLRLLGMELNMGRGPQQCWSRLGKPDKFIFKSMCFKLVRHKKSSSAE